MKRAALIVSLLASANATAVESLDFSALAAQCAPGVHIKTLSSIVRHESRVNPYAIGVNAKGARLPRQPSSREEAIATATWLKANGYNFDSGFGQVNSSNMDWLGMSIADLFDPCKNLAGAARVITACYQRAKTRYSGEQSALHAALSCYNTGDFEKGIRNGYVMAVASNAVLEVPGLLPITTGTPAPVQLKTIAPPVSVKPASANPVQEGIGDAFSRPSAGVFEPKHAEHQGDQDTGEDAAKSESVILYRE